MPKTAEIVINWGEFGEIKLEAGSFCPLVWKEKKVGWVLRSCQGCRPLFISPGHLITVAESQAATPFAGRPYLEH